MQVCCSLQGSSGLELAPGALEFVLVPLVTCLQLVHGSGPAASALGRSGGTAAGVAVVLQADPALLHTVERCLTSQLPAHLLACPAEQTRVQSQFGDRGALLVAAHRGLEALRCLLNLDLLGAVEMAPVVKQYVCVFDTFWHLLPPGELLLLRAGCMRAAGLRSHAKPVLHGIHFWPAGAGAMRMGQVLAAKARGKPRRATCQCLPASRFAPE